MYAPNGISLSDVGDIEVFPHGDELHLFHLTLPNHDVVQHRVSTDGLAWRALPNALRTGDPGDADDDQIWTMSVTEHAGRFVMLYTALTTADGGHVQRTGLAVSDDLIRWTKSGRNPVAEADPRWYEADPATIGNVSWRDPKPIRVGDTYYAVVCAREAAGPLMRRGAAGLFTSTDMETWTVQPPLFAPRRYWDLECPQVFEIGGRFYLTAGIMEDGTQRYWVAPAVEGPYAVPADGGILAPIGHYAGRVCRWQGRDLYLCWHEPRPQARNRITAPLVDWARVRNPHGKFVVAPLVLEPRPDGSLARRSFPGWDAYRAADLAPAAPKRTTLFRGAAVDTDADGETWRIADETGGMDVLATETEAGDAWFEGILTVDAAAGGIAFRLDDDGGGYVITLSRNSTEVLLQKWLPRRDPLSGLPWFTVTDLQRGVLRRPLTPGDPLPFRLLLVGPYIECSLDGEAVLATLSAERAHGRLGLWAESGSVTATGVRHAPMRRPEHG